MKKGCELFTAWGWKSGDPQMEYQVVACPDEFQRIVGAAFAADGVQPFGPSTPTTPTTRAPVPPPSAPSAAPEGCTSLGCGCDWATTELCAGGGDSSACFTECCCLLDAASTPVATPTTAPLDSGTGDTNSPAATATMAAASLLASAALLAALVK